MKTYFFDCIFCVGSALTQSCAVKVVSKDGRPLHDAAKSSFMAK